MTQSIITLLYELVFIILSTCINSHHHNQPMETKKTEHTVSQSAKSGSHMLSLGEILSFR